MKNWKCVEESFHDPIICLGLREVARKSPDSRIPGLVLNPGPSGYEGGLLPTLPRSSIIDRLANGRYGTMDHIFMEFNVLPCLAVGWMRPLQ